MVYMGNADGNGEEEDDILRHHHQMLAAVHSGRFVLFSCVD